MRKSVRDYSVRSIACPLETGLTALNIFFVFVSKCFFLFLLYYLAVWNNFDNNKEYSKMEKLWRCKCFRFLEMLGKNFKKLVFFTEFYLYILKNFSPMQTSTSTKLYECYKTYNYRKKSNFCFFFLF